MLRTPARRRAAWARNAPCPHRTHRNQQRMLGHGLRPTTRPGSWLMTHYDLLPRISFVGVPATWSHVLIDAPFRSRYLHSARARSGHGVLEGLDREPLGCMRRSASTPAANVRRHVDPGLRDIPASSRIPVSVICPMDHVRRLDACQPRTVVTPERAHALRAWQSRCVPWASTRLLQDVPEIDSLCHPTEAPPLQ